MFLRRLAHTIASQTDELKRLLLSQYARKGKRGDLAKRKARHGVRVNACVFQFVRKRQRR